jgi:hypothetical protein
MIQDALLITAGAFLLALAYLGLATWLTSRRDRLDSPDLREDRS